MKILSIHLSPLRNVHGIGIYFLSRVDQALAKRFIKCNSISSAFASSPRLFHICNAPFLFSFLGYSDQNLSNPGRSASAGQDLLILSVLLTGLLYGIGGLILTVSMVGIDFSIG